MVTKREPVYIFGVPAKLGGASTKLKDLLRLLHEDFEFTVLFKDVSFYKDPEVTRFLNGLGVRCGLRKDLPGRASGVGLAVCELDFFSSGYAERVKNSGLRVLWSNDMMWAFEGEAEASAKGLIDRVVFVSELQQSAFAAMYRDVEQVLIPNYITPDEFPLVERNNPSFAIGRLSRPDPVKYPVDFPVFYEELGLDDVTYRVQAWNDELRKKYSWHKFGPEWELLPANKMRADKFLGSLDLFVYPIGHECVESWGRSTVEAMLTGCVPIVPSGHHFHRLMVHGESGFICSTFAEFQSAVRLLHSDGRLRRRIGRTAAEHARTVLCNPAHHRSLWLKALSFPA